MLDAHIHFEKQAYNYDTIYKMIAQALKVWLDEIYLLDHTHKFYEFAPIYQPVLKNKDVSNWFNSTNKCSINEYLAFIKIIESYHFPLKINFGLEVCYIEESEEELRQLLKKYPFSFLIGSVHYIDDFPFDLSKKLWEKQNVDYLYKRYYEIMKKLIKSDLFTILGHPDSIKLYNYYPRYDLSSTYHEIAHLLKEHKMITENNSGLIRYGFSYPGLNPLFYNILKEKEVSILLSSDAHVASDIGRVFNQLSS